MDSLSRSPHPSALGVGSTVYRSVCDKIQSPPSTVRVAGGRSKGVGALSFSWEGLNAYAFPPVALIHRVLLKARLERPRLILVAPRWQSRPWFPLLLELASGPPSPLEVGEFDLFQPGSRVVHANPGMLQLHGWLLFGDTFNPRVSLTMLSL
jgi:hypothetical protein